MLSQLLFAIIIFNNDVYVAGYQHSISGHDEPVYWENGEMVKLPSGNFDSRANAIFIKN